MLDGDFFRAIRQKMHLSGPAVGELNVSFFKSLLGVVVNKPPKPLP
jgi:hypothetical protein